MPQDAPLNDDAPQATALVGSWSRACRLAMPNWPIDGWPMRWRWRPLVRLWAS